MGFYGNRVLPHVINVVMDTKRSRAIRARVCRDLSGEVLEIGFGTGHNLPYLPDTVSRLLAVEPSGGGVRLAQERIRSSGVTVDLVGLDGQQLPLDDASVDAVLCTWSLCTIPDPVAAVAEARRVLRIALDLRRPPLVALDEDARREPVEIQAGGVIPEHARRHLGRRRHVRDDVVPGPRPAPGHAGERHARAEELEPAPPAHRGRIARARRELPRRGLDELG